MRGSLHSMKKASMTHNKRAALLACLAAAGLLASPALLAQDAGWYAGGNVGQSAATIDEGRIRSGLNNQVLVVSGFSEDDRDTGYKLFGGYQFNRYFGLEGGWFDLGSAGFNASTTPAGTLSGNIRMRGLSLDAVGTLPLGERLSLLGRIGMAHTRTRGSFASTGAVTMPYPATRTSDSSVGLKLGLGAAWRLNDAWSVRGEVERFRVSDTVGNKGHVDLFSVGLVYRFGGTLARSGG
jgi:OOP family OmpA-OmpF porin